MDRIDTRAWPMAGMQARESLPTGMCTRALLRVGVRALQAGVRTCALLLTAALPPVTAAAPDPSATPPVATDDACAAVRRAIERLDEQTRVHLHAVTGTGRNPGGYQTADSYLIDDRQWLYLDGRLNAHGLARRADGTRDRSSGVAMLAPPEECESLAPTTIDGRPVRGFRYDVPVEVGLNRLTMWIDPDSGLPWRVSIAGPEWVMGRVLSRPGTPPQVTPRKNGRRYSEQIEFRYDSVRLP
ncbi:MAG TPA: hypothetical protein PKA20_16115 [Burkholderiaceae bacterium]|nr:hypothetical protein [Burkholderiaceae bacterium]